MALCGLSDPLPSVCFERKAQFSASRGLYWARSKHFKLPEPESHQPDVWSIKPPDFSLRLYRSLSLAQRKDRKTFTVPAAPQKTRGRFMPDVSRESGKKNGPVKFVTSYRPPDALEAELRFVRTGKFPSEPYENLRPHDFRPLDENLTDMVTTYERDPGNLKFKLKHLDTMLTTQSDTCYTLRDTRTRMDTFKPAEPQWDKRLVLPPSPWPPKSASYTRHRRSRRAYSAFLDRVEEKLSRSWKLQHVSRLN